MAPGFSERDWAAGTGAHLRCHHSVEFYQPGFFPADTIATFFSDGLETGEAVVAVATAAHVQQIRDGLVRQHVNVERLEQTGVCVWLEAQEALSVLRAAGPLKKETVEGLMQPLLVSSGQASATGRLRTYGEVVSLMAEEGDYRGCVELERHWAGILTMPSVQVRSSCAYSTEVFYGDFAPWMAQQLCNVHQEIKPMVGGAKSWLAVVVEQARALREAAGVRGRLEEELLHSETREIERFRERMASLREMRLRRAESGPEDWHSEQERQWMYLVKKTLKQILAYCGEVMDARRNAAEGSTEWHKRTGEILACARLTSLLAELEAWGGDDDGVVH